MEIVKHWCSCCDLTVGLAQGGMIGRVLWSNKPKQEALVDYICRHRSRHDVVHGAWPLWLVSTFAGRNFKILVVKFC